MGTSNITISSVWFASTPSMSFALTAWPMLRSVHECGSYSSSAASAFPHGRIRHGRRPAPCALVPRFGPSLRIVERPGLGSTSPARGAMADRRGVAVRLREAEGAAGPDRPGGLTPVGRGALARRRTSLRTRGEACTRPGLARTPWEPRSHWIVRGVIRHSLAIPCHRAPSSASGRSSPRRNPLVSGVHLILISR
jgi:hypothetical protein